MDGTTLGPYKILQKLGAGGMGEVYRARDTRLRRNVAIKRVAGENAGSAKRRRAVMNEARSAARVTHQNIAALHDVFEQDGELYIVMEHVEGETLRTRLGRTIGLETILDIATQCAEGLVAAHDRGVVHGDIKPDNVMVAAGGLVKILDFGVAHRETLVSEDTETDTIAGSAIGPLGGTISYMAPEALLGGEFDHRVDVFSLGVMLYQMLSGVHPFTANTGPATVDRILHGQPPRLDSINPRVPDYLVPIVEKMLAKSADDRYQTVSDLLEDLRVARSRVTDPSLDPRADGRRPSPDPTPGWGRVGGYAGAALALIALAALAIWGTTSAPAPGTGSPTARFDPTDWIIAVLATPVAENDAEMVALNEGLAATLNSKLTQLSRAHDLQVIPAASLRDREINGLASAREEFGITLAIDFQARRAGDRLRVNVNLIDTRGERQLDSATVDGRADDPIDLEEQVALRALRMLRLELLPMEQGLLAAGTDEPRAHDYYLRALGYLQEYANPDSIEAAAGLLEQSLRIDPNYAQAHAALGEALWHRYQLTDSNVWVERAAQECQTAVDLAPESGAAHRCLGTVYNGTGRTDDAIEALEQARKLDPTDDAVYIALGSAYQNAGDPGLAESTYEDAVALRPHYWGGYSWLGTFYLSQGRTEEAIENLQQVVQLAPDSYRGYSNLGVAYFVAEDWLQAGQAFERALELKPDYSRAISNLGTLYFFQGRYAESARMFERAVELADRNYLRWGNLADAYYFTRGEESRAPDAYRRAIELADEQLQVNPADTDVLGSVARFHAMLGEAGPAQAYLDRALAQTTDNEVLHTAAQVHVVLGSIDAGLDFLGRAVAAGYQRAEIAADPLFESVRDDPRYVAIMGDA